MTTVRLALVPRDGFFCKDGRGWHTSASGRGHALDWPWPSTLLGALRTAWGRQNEERTGRALDRDGWRALAEGLTLGRTLMLRRESIKRGAWKTEDRIWPAPADALLEEHRALRRLDPVPPLLPTLGRDDDPAREGLWVPRIEDRAKPLPMQRRWNDANFMAWLAGQEITLPAPAAAPETARRVQAHVGIQPETLTADEGVLFSHEVIETLERRAEWAAGVEATCPAGPPPPLVTLGSDGRLARVEPLPSELFEPPAALLDGFRKAGPGIRLVAVTPACFARGWLPDGFETLGNEYRGHLPAIDAELILRAALVPRPLHVSGWDMAKREPKPTARLVAPGAVYFFERTDGKRFDAQAARSLWLAPLGERTEEGYGRFVPGVWTPRRN